MEYSKDNGGYGRKRPVWQWILIYLIIAVVVYTAGFYIYKAVKDDTADNTETNQTDSLY